MYSFLGIDVGTSGVRGCVIDADGRQLADARVGLPPPRRAGAAVEQDPDSWWTALVDTLDALAPRAELARVAAVCLDGTSSTLLLCDDGGTPLTPALMYNDARATQAAVRIEAVAPADSPARGASSSLAKLLWLLDTPAAAGATKALHQADWLLGRLSGRFDFSDENNALKLGYDPLARGWPDWLDALPLPRMLLPEVVPAGRTIGRLAPTICKQWGFASDTRVTSGTTDSTAGFIATGAGPGDAVTTLGSTLVLKILAGQPIAAAGLGVYSHRLGDRWLVGGASNSGGAVLRQLFTDDEIARYTAQLKPQQPTGLDYYPLPGPGERFPVSDPQLAPRLAPRPADDALFFQAILEGITAIEVRGYRVLEQLGAPAPRRVITTGGGAVNEGWREMRERALGVPVIAAEHQEAAYGAALLALRSAPL
ncbi:MAG: FGGY-family carbohydrate kinase [Thiohalobacterales bacterium]|nr:FGGY-family carbohydrate kinase [Thiohalobacterales bacterium]